MPLRRSVLAVLVSAAGLVIASCEPIVPRPVSQAPLNTCPCERYSTGSSTPARCSSSGRCELLTPGGRPAYPFWLVVHVPTSSIFAPGHSFVLYSDQDGKPAFRERAAEDGTFARCQPPLCLPLGALVSTTGSYRVSSEASRYVGYPLVEGASIPVRVAYEPIGNEQQEDFPQLPLDALFSASMRLDKSGRATFGRALPVGRYRRIFFPEAPFDEIFPPRVDTVGVGSNFLDVFTLGGETSIDDMGGSTRAAKVTRQEGLDGWRVWLVDHPSQRRISVVRTLSGIAAEVELYTTGESRTSQGGLGDDVEAVVAPPESWNGVPTYVTPLFGGAGLESLDVPSFAPPVSVAGVVAVPTSIAGGALLGYSAQVVFKSVQLATTDGASTLLRYQTSVNSDDRGRFATVLPAGTYVATISPAEGTGFAVRKEVVVVDRARAALTFQPPLRTIVKGRAVLTDGRALSDAEVLALPRRSVATTTLVAEPRPQRTRTTDEGRFTLELDPGAYVFSIVPRANTGFPRISVQAEIPSSATVPTMDVPDARVPVPVRLAFTLRDPSPTGNPIANAVVRVFAMPVARGDASVVATDEPVEVGSAMTNSEGAVELLLAEAPP